MNKKAPNFSSEEETILVQLVRKNKEVLECQQTDFVSPRDKKRAWEEVELEFNFNPSTQPRSASSLREKYNNLKKKLRKELSDEKAHVSGTGGGPPTQVVELEDKKFKLLELMGIEKAVGRRSSYDSDSGSVDLMIIPKVEHSQTASPTQASNSTPCLLNNGTACSSELSDSVSREVIFDLEFTVSDAQPENTGASGRKKKSNLLKTVLKASLPVGLTPTVNLASEENVSDVENGWGSHNVGDLRTPVTNVLRSRLRRVTNESNRVSEWANTKVATSKLVQEQTLRQMNEMHLNKMAMLEEKSRIERDILELQLENAREQLAHDRKIRQIQWNNGVME